MDLASGVESWFDSPGDVLAVLSVIALLIAGVFFLVDARIGSIRQAVDDLKESNDAQHELIRERLDQHAASPVHERRNRYDATTPYRRRKEDDDDG